MTRILKTPLEKLKTKIKALISNDIFLKEENQKIKMGDTILFSYNTNKISYKKNRYYPSKIDNIIQEDFEVSFPLTAENLTLLSSNISNPPIGARIIIDLFHKNGHQNINKVSIGESINSIKGNQLLIKKDFYETILNINKEESVDKKVRFNDRIYPFLKKEFNIIINNKDITKDYSLLLEEIIASGQLTQQDVIKLTNNLDKGNSINVVIEKQIVKQVEWLIQKIQDILDEGHINKSKAKDLGNLHFGFLKSSITGPEHLMEKILTKYGKYTLFGVPVLLNTDKYVIHQKGLSRSQFDIILINHLSDIEVVELKRSDSVVLDYDENRNKFYASKELSIAVSQAERYISALYHGNDDEYKIDGLKIKDFINREIGGSMIVDIVRPKALIILGSFLTIAPDYDLLDDKIKNKVSKNDYNLNYLQTYKELKNTYKNIQILTYTELIDIARTRLLKQDNN